MQGEKSSRAPFDDRAALEELERLQRSIQEYRRRREEAEGAFEQFVGSFKKPSAAADNVVSGPRTPPLPGFHTEAAPPAPASVPVAPPRPSPAPIAAARAAVAPAPVVAAPPVPAAPSVARTADAAPWDSGRSAVPEPPPLPPKRADVLSPDSAPSVAAIAATAGATKAGSEEIGGPAASRTWTPGDQEERESGPAPAVSLPDNFFASATRRSSGQDPEVGTPQISESGGRRFPGWIPWAFVATAAVLISAVFLMRSGQVPAAPDAAPAAATVETPAAAPPAAPLATPTPPPAPAASPAPPAEIRTLRSVWVRVTVDGRRELERELEADARIPLPAGSSFVIRAGDAGAVRFLLNGKDQGALGADAQVVTRTFTTAAP